MTDTVIPPTASTLILSGFGTNCERETAYACHQAGAVHVTTGHINGLYAQGEGRIVLQDYRFLILIGGFLDGDDLGGGRACANRFRYRALPGGGTVLERLRSFIGHGGLVLGICNGFQLLIRLGLLPGLENGDDRQLATITTNARGRFEDRWVRLQPNPASPCVFTRGLEPLELPIRHGEGRMVGESPELLEMLVERGLVPLRYSLPDGTPTEEYPANPNGSPLGVAALCNPSGTVMGLMPHPEAFNHYTNHPQWTRRTHEGEAGAGLALFRNAYTWLEAQGG